jgi:hypothetical protein
MFEERKKYALPWHTCASTFALAANGSKGLSSAPRVPRARWPMAQGSMHTNVCYVYVCGCAYAFICAYYSTHLHIVQATMHVEFVYVVCEGICIFVRGLEMHKYRMLANGSR